MSQFSKKSLDLPVWKALKNKTVVLASQSPRRKEILQAMGLTDFQIVPTLKPDENDPTSYKTTEDYVLDTARMKALEVWERCQTDESLPNADVVIAADTIVVYNNQVLEKPKDAADAQRVLRLLSGHTHEALTAVHLVAQDLHYHFVTRTFVTFADLDDTTIQEYIRAGEPFDKAGSYGIQGAAALFISKIDGDYWNVVGLPQQPLFQQLVRLVQEKQW
ncbi:Maf-like protein [Hesseltinella vesiculosa]|uniref:Maf-like protein n=1 Tax=Hesseltinella vesiculosa TaxID=101127 RepID=A0A1X2G4D9_9FUNG|nr:Maf-like protein [Hesseltinella vesiculosa]